MVCHHGPNDIECSKHPNHDRYYPPTPPVSVTPDASNYQILDVHRVGSHLVLKVAYPNCARCAFEGNKILVFFNVAEMDALRWRRIDPHFRDPKLKGLASDAPSPAARFPATDEGWADAINYAKSKPS
jgi:hypothetical protein